MSVIRRRSVHVGVAAAVAAVVGAFAVSAALGNVTVSRAELTGTRLRVEGTALPSRTITVDGVTMGTSDGAGKFRIERDPFAAPADCAIDVNDGSATATTVTLSGCTVTTTPPPAAASLSSVRVDPTDVVGGDAATGTVTLTAAAPSEGVAVALSSDNTAAATVPPSVTVPGGSTSASFTVSTSVVSNSQSANIIGTAGGVTAHATMTVWTKFAFSNGSIAILPGGNGSGRVTSQPVGIDCTIVAGNGSGACSAFFPAGTVVRLDARPAADSKFLGWRGLPGCADPSKIVVARGTTITCQPGFSLK
ncbi:MAG: hypothetical protein M3322_04395 [Actinomycetota bacterium]|nr:hypothetical protein [Actinomycetota bacterium]